MQNVTTNFIDLCMSIFDKEMIVSEDKYYKMSFSPKIFLETFIEKHPYFKNEQQDCIEFIRKLLEDISMENNRNKNINSYSELSLENKNKNIQSKEFNEYFLSRENSFITDYFYFQLINIFTCECGEEFYSFQKLIDIPLLIPILKGEISLKELIKEFMREIMVNLKVKCRKCKIEMENIKKKIRFNILNDFIIFSIQRFDPKLSIKNNIRINFEEIIDLNEFCDCNEDNTSTQFKLFALINHIGSINYGQYYSLIKLEDEWYEFNDSNTIKLNNIENYSTNVCIFSIKK